ncbi:MAG: class I SAM-dependent methyltransferase [Treponema sp.]|jgi:SAM-dependent methyltransferase|nr:class I SAM-dependent methyltransferase [Treponema sp.]
MVCWVCGSSKVTLLRTGVSELQPDDFKITDSRYGTTLPLFRCTSCGFLQADTGRYTIEKFYTELEDQAYIESAVQREKQCYHLLMQTRKYMSIPKPKILDIGAGAGLLVKEAAKLGWDVQGIDPSVYLSEKAKKAGLPVVQGIFPHAACPGPYDAIFLIDVIEHMEHPLDLLSALSGYLDKAGIIVLVTPNVSSLMAKLMGKKWWHYRIAHIGYYNKKTLTILMKRSGFSPVRFTLSPWYFSGDYILQRLVRYIPVSIPPPPPPRGRNHNMTAYLKRMILPINFFDSLTAVFSNRNRDRT